MSRDPIGYEGSPWNLYEYVQGCPASHTDPIGLANAITDGFWAMIDHFRYRRCAFDYTKKVLQEMLAIGDALLIRMLPSRPGYKSCASACPTDIINGPPPHWSFLRPAIKHALTYEAGDISWSSDYSSHNWWFVPGITLPDAFADADNPQPLITFWVHEGQHDISQYGMGHGSWFSQFTLDDIAGIGKPGDTGFDPLGLASVEPPGGSLLTKFRKYLSKPNVCGNKSILDTMMAKLGPHKCGKKR